MIRASKSTGAREHRSQKKIWMAEKNQKKTWRNKKKSTEKEKKRTQNTELYTYGVNLGVSGSSDP